jgi:hypothetical protein
MRKFCLIRKCLLCGGNKIEVGFWRRLQVGCELLTDTFLLDCEFLEKCFLGQDCEI